MAEPADAKAYARPRAEGAGLHWPTYELQIEKESGWRHWSAPGVVKSSPTGSMGLGQLNSRFYPESDWRDPYRNLDRSIVIMAGYLAKFGTYRKALAAYNWGPAHVGGGRFDDGRGFGVQDHSPWDGTRDWRCSAGHGVSAQCLRYLDTILGPGWPEPGVSPMPTPSGIVYEDFRDPEPAGRFARTPKGVILHGSRSGRAGNPKDTEYLGTARYEQSNPAGLGWNATIGEDKVAVHLTPQEWGWNARAASDDYLGVEIAQATVDEPITDAQVDALADWIRTRVLPAWPNLPMAFPSHAELDGTPEYGSTRDGKSDVYPRGDARMEELRSRLLARLEGGTQPMPAPEEPVFAAPGEVGSGLLELMAKAGTVPYGPSTFLPLGRSPAVYEEAIDSAGTRWVWHLPTGRHFRYPAA